MKELKRPKAPNFKKGGTENRNYFCSMGRHDPSIHHFFFQNLMMTRWVDGVIDPSTHQTIRPNNRDPPMHGTREAMHAITNQHLFRNQYMAMANRVKCKASYVYWSLFLRRDCCLQQRAAFSFAMQHSCEAFVQAIAIPHALQ